MERSYRGLGLVALILLVVAPLSLFAVLALFEDESQDSILISLDGVHGTSELDGALLESPDPWQPGEVRSVIVYVENAGPDAVDAEVAVTARSIDALVRDGYLTLGAAVDEGPSAPLGEATATQHIVIDDLAGGESVPVTISATFASTAPIGASLDSQALHLGLVVSGSRTEEAGAPSLLDAAGAQLWLAPVFLVAAAVVALIVQARRRARSGRLQ